MINVNTIYKTLSILLMYPDIKFRPFLKDFLIIFYNEKILSKESHESIIFFINFLLKEDIFLLQQMYIDTFDKKNIHSLYLFEHIHGDSKDRGQAMVDLQNMYISSGYKISSYELPDYFPVFLEYLSLISEKDAKILLLEVINIILIIAIRLRDSNNIYSKLFFILEELSNVKPDENIINLALSYKKNMNFEENFEGDLMEDTFQYNKKISNNY
ncbi:MAG TPA: nitrate reductase molybdenum cofactor assembly chaperone [Candidatus Azosocius sp. HAIN]